MRARDLTGLRSGKLTAVKYVESKNNRRIWLVACDCGKQKTVAAGDFTSGRLVSCGCHKIKVVVKRNKEDLSVHNMTGTRTYHTWNSMKQRCFYANDTAYKYYGGRGVTVCESWRNDFVTFLNDMGVRPEGKTLDRINPFGNYEPDNCRWATLKEQAANKRSNHANSG